MKFILVYLLILITNLNCMVNLDNKLYGKSAVNNRQRKGDYGP